MNLQNTSKWINQLQLKRDIQIPAHVEDYANHGGTKNWKDMKSKLNQKDWFTQHKYISFRSWFVGELHKIVVCTL
ncbi:hypothetical protein AMTRI_Chr05g62370 [Amborella trichopoda]